MSKTKELYQSLHQLDEDDNAAMRNHYAQIEQQEQEYFLSLKNK
jgi:hypothetical protein